MSKMKDFVAFQALVRTAERKPAGNLMLGNLRALQSFRKPARGKIQNVQNEVIVPVQPV
jgi:hypothetical protein